jgi:integrase
MSTLDIKRHFTRDRSGTINRLTINPGEIKNTYTIEAVIPPELARHLETYIHVHRQSFKNAHSTTYLWPGEHGGHAGPCTIAKNIKALVEERIGVDFNIHAIRHIVATLLLEDDPNNLPLAKQMLGHRDAKTTERIYGHARTTAAQKTWGESLARRITDATDARKPPRGKKPNGKTPPKGGPKK